MSTLESYRFLIGKYHLMCSYITHAYTKVFLNEPIKGIELLEQHLSKVLEN